MTKRGDEKLLLVISQVFTPDPAAVGQSIADACARLAERDVASRVITARHGYYDASVEYPPFEQSGKVTIERLSTLQLRTRGKIARALRGVGFLVSATIRACRGPRPAAVLVSTSPPVAPVAGLIAAAWHRAPLVHWSMDLNPDQAIEAGYVSADGLGARLLDWMNRLLLRRAHTIIVLDRAMEKRVRAKGDPQGRLHVVPPWGALSSIETIDPRASAFRRRHGLDDKFVVMYSGNHSLVHPLDTLLDAAKRLENDSRFAFVFIGDGHGKRSVDASGLRNVLSLPYQPRETLADSLGCADLHVVTMGDRMLGIVHPSKIYGVLTVGRPVLYFGPVESHVDVMVRDHSIGWSLRHGDIDAAVASLHEAIAMTPDEISMVSRRVLDLARGEYHPKRLQNRVADIVERAVGL